MGRNGKSMIRNGKRILCLLLLGAMLLLLTGCDRTDVMNNFETALLQLRDALTAAEHSTASSDQEQAAMLNATTEDVPEDDVEFEYILSENELPLVPE